MKLGTLVVLIILSVVLFQPFLNAQASLRFSSAKCRYRNFKQKVQIRDNPLCIPKKIRRSKCVGSCKSSAFPIVSAKGNQFRKICNCCTPIVEENEIVQFDGCEDTLTLPVIKRCECRPCGTRDEL
ncbi:predicted protein [Nematostella vectensis]|uniref:Glycoprotein hormone subunit beta domain-containing protein n=1 Tax=Nematostella vectensis TaxID=45351 RepID=A7RH96_NEMVE|nr:predicted protein [Nematostella vectensis]|eukprot:XP_001641376.1 predicted protein [Nematostella vectensis]